MKNKEQQQQQPQPQRQSRAGEWLDAHRGGIITVNDWRAVNK